jgi:hypothetical protein
MFNAVVDRKKRRAWTMGAIAISVAAHLLVLGEIVAAANRPAWVVIGECLDCGWDPDSWEPGLPALRVRHKITIPFTFTCMYIVMHGRAERDSTPARDPPALAG